jgi:prepilin-type N-terminal cleavage/methylation domain-containing protein
MFLRDDKPPRKSVSSGYTLPETLAVIAITGLLAGIAIPSYLAIVDRVRCLNFGNLEVVNQRCPLEATILNPPNGGSVPRTVDFNGTFKSLPKGPTMWIYIYAPTERKFYFNQVININHRAKTWKLENVVIGELGDTGKTFKAGIFIADLEGTMELREDVGEGRSDFPSGKNLNEFTITRQ